METKKSSPRFLDKVKKTLFTSAIFLLVFTAIFLVDLKTRVRSVVIKDEKSDLIAVGLAGYQNKSLFLISQDELAKELKGKNPYLASVKVEKKFPSMLVLYPEFYNPVAALQVSAGYFVLSSDGRILAKSQTTTPGLTSINYYQKLNYYSFSAGDYLDLKDIGLGVEFSQALLNLGLKVDILDIVDRDMLVCNVGEKKIIFTAVKDKELQIYELNQIVKQFKIKGQDFKSIDLRFEKPVVTL